MFYYCKECGSVYFRPKAKTLCIMPGCPRKFGEILLPINPNKGPLFQ